MIRVRYADGPLAGGSQDSELVEGRPPAIAVRPTEVTPLGTTEGPIEGWYIPVGGQDPDGTYIYHWREGPEKPERPS